MLNQRTHIIRWFIVFLMSGLLSGCGQQPGGSLESLPDLAHNYPRVDGSTSAHPLQRALACQIMQVPCRWSTSYQYGRTIIPDPEYATAPDLLEAIGSGIQHHGTHRAYMNLIDGKVDFILVARVPSEDELRAAREHGVALDVRAVALDAFVFLVNIDNPVDNLDLETVRSIYTGSISNWADVGGPCAGIIAFQRQRNSGSQELMEALVMRGTPMLDLTAKLGLMVIDMGGMLNQVGYAPSGIGYSVYYYAVNMLPDERVKLVGIDGVTPNAETISARSYSLTTEVYAVVREAMPAEGAALVLRNWLFTDAGKAAIAASGYVPLP